MSTAKVIWCDTWFVPLYFGFCPSELAWNRMLRRFNIDPKLNTYPSKAGCCSSLVNSTNDVVLVVTINESSVKANKLGARYIASVLVHEATHVWQRMCEQMGDESPSHETEAYSVQHITRSLFRAYEETRGPLFRK